MKKAVAFLAIAMIAAAIVFWFLTRPQFLASQTLAEIDNGVPSRGEVLFWAGGCGSCHAKKSAKGKDKLLLGGGHELITPAGTFVSPNISPDPETGIGKWTGEEFANAMLRGVSPDGSHYYPSFPYTSYARMTLTDVADLWAYLKTLPAVSRANEPHDLALPFKMRRGLGLWKWMFLGDAPVAPVDTGDPVLARGQYLVEGPGHCGECHTPRSIFGFGGPDASRWLAGGPAPEGKGFIPNITPHESTLGGWSADDISSYLETGFTPDYDSVGGSMVSVQDNMSKLTKEDIAAIAAYLKAVPPIAK